jgi:hypothetical protein
MIRDAKANGVASDKAMWQSVDTLSDMLCILIGCTIDIEYQLFNRYGD